MNCSVEAGSSLRLLPSVCPAPLASKEGAHCTRCASFTAVSPSTVLLLQKRMVTGRRGHEDSQQSSVTVPFRSLFLAVLWVRARCSEQKSCRKAVFCSIRWWAQCCDQHKGLSSGHRSTLWLRDTMAPASPLPDMHTSLHFIIFTLGLYMLLRGRRQVAQGRG